MRACCRLWFSVLLAVGLSAISVIARLHFIQTRALAGRLDGQEPESHILVTDLAFGQTSWRTHHFLPIFTLGAPYDKYADDHPGAESPDSLGNYYYASAPPLTFVLPYFAIRSVGATPGIESLRWYNIFLQITSALAIAALVFLCGKRAAAGAEQTWLASATAAVVYMCAPECLKSHSINLWSQQFFALWLMLQIICYLFFPRALLLFVFAFVGCLADWTPYLANAAMAGVALIAFYKKRDRRALHSAIALLSGCALAGACMIFWFASVMPPGDYFSDLAARSSARAGSLSRILRLFVEYSNSLGVFSIVGLLALSFRPWRALPHQPAIGAVFLAQKNPVVIALIILLAALLENPLMADHAARYSYDRLKAVQLLALVAAWAAMIGPRQAKALLISSAVAGLASIYIFLKIYDTPGGWGYIGQTEQQRLGNIIATTASTNGPAFFQGDIRGAEVFYAGRNIVMIYPKADPATWAQQWCRHHHFAEGTVYEISGHYPNPSPAELPRSVHVYRVHAYGKISEIGLFQLPEKPGDYHPVSYFEDPSHNWRRLRAVDVMKILLWQ